jgi:hypothetical protein
LRPPGERGRLGIVGVRKKIAVVPHSPQLQRQPERSEHKGVDEGRAPAMFADGHEKIDAADNRDQRAVWPRQRRQPHERGGKESSVAWRPRRQQHEVGTQDE